MRHHREACQQTILPALEGGVITGARIFPAGPRALWELIGIRGSDVVVRVNERAMDSGDAILDGLGQVCAAARPVRDPARW